MTPKQIMDALRGGSAYAEENNRPDRHRIMLSSGTIIDSSDAYMSGGVLIVYDTNRSILFLDPQAVILIANALLPVEAQIDVQAGELATKATQ